MDMNSYADATLVVKRTFLEFERVAPARLERALSAPCLASSSTGRPKKLSLDTTDSDCESTVGTTTAPSDGEVGEIDVFVEEMSPALCEADALILSAHARHSHAACPAALPMQTMSPPAWMGALSMTRVDSTRGQGASVMLRNIPNDYTRAMVIELLDQEGFYARYNFLYVPIDFKSGAARGYAFVNLASQEDADAFIAHFSGFRHWAFPSRKVAEVSWAHANHQGFARNVEYYRNSSVMHAVVPDECKTVLFCKGVRVAFPAPTWPVSMPDGLW